MSSFLFYSREGSLWVAWLVTMMLLWLGFGINWVLVRAIPALTRAIDTIEVALNATNRPISTTTESEGQG